MIKELSERDKACIALKVPQADQSELNELITQCRKLDTLQAMAVAMPHKLKTADGSPFSADTHLQGRAIQASQEYLYSVLG